ncbi:MAG TPA: hypothetical protein VF525_03015 [Pyrinomonadaceae bacterium]|jgi:hypothetical protein
MHTFIKLLCCFVVSFACAPVSSAQRSPVRPVAPTPRPAKPIWTIVTDANVEDGSALVTLEPVPLVPSVPGRTEAFLTANFTIQGQPATRPSFVAVTFLSRGPACRFTPQANLVLLLDGRPLTLTYQTQSPQGEGVWRVSQETESGVCGEALGAFVSPQTFTRIAAARTGTAKTGTTVFNLTGTPLDALRDLARRLPPQ